jgi:hypothetical protein
MREQQRVVLLKKREAHNDLDQNDDYENRHRDFRVDDSGSSFERQNGSTYHQDKPEDSHSHVNIAKALNIRSHLKTHEHLQDCAQQHNRS